MSKLGYTWYPKDFISDPDVMFMTASERGVYRDLIDLAYMSDNKIRYTVEMLARYTNSDIETVEKILSLKGKKVGEFWTIPSCNKRILLAEKNRKNGQKGGRPKTQTKPKQNPDVNPSVTNAETQTERQREREREREIKREIENENQINSISKNDSFLQENLNSQSWLEVQAMQNHITIEQVKEQLLIFNRYLQSCCDEKLNRKDYNTHFTNWMKTNKPGNKSQSSYKANFSNPIL